MLRVKGRIQGRRGHKCDGNGGAWFKKPPRCLGNAEGKKRKPAKKKKKAYRERAPQETLPNKLKSGPEKTEDLQRKRTG